MKDRKKAYLALATGRIFEGWHFGADVPEKGGEVIFNTSLTGYQEIITDPSYQGQIVVMTPSHIGNYGINLEDVESKKIFLSGFVVQELSGVVSNWRANMSLEDYFKKAGVPGMTGVDTRALTRHLRSLGAVNGIMSTDGAKPEALIKKAKALPSMEGQDLVKQVTSDKSYGWTEGSGTWSSWAKHEGTKKKVVVIDFGVKLNILRCLVDLNCDVTVVPATTPAKEIMAFKPDGIMLSNGPGDPAAVTYGVQTIRDLVQENEGRIKKGSKPMAIFGICLGHQMTGLALGGETFKLKFGHHGSNHPVKEFQTARVDVTSQNHGFGVAAEKDEKGEWILKGNKDVWASHVSLNDNTVEGLQHKSLPLFSVQYHPEASAGPHDARHLFERFINLMEKN